MTDQVRTTVFPPVKDVTVPREPNAIERAEAIIEAWDKPKHIKDMALASIRMNASMNLMVRTFHEVYGHPILRPSDAREDFSHITRQRLATRFSMIDEELRELYDAMDIRIELNYYYLDEDENWVKAANVLDAIENTEERNLSEVADACFDLKYVITGFEYELGIEPQACAVEGQCANLSKLDHDGKAIVNGHGKAAVGTPLYRHDQPIGKVLKGPNYFKADMRNPLAAFGMRFGAKASMYTPDAQGNTIRDK